MKITGAISALAIASGLPACKQAVTEKDVQEEKPNIILIVADDVYPEHLSCYGGNIPTPNIDRLANEGIKYSKAYCVSSVCTPSRYTIMTGQYAGRCKDKAFISENPLDEAYNLEWNTPINEDNLVLHEVMNEAGYYTGFVGKYHIGKDHFDKHRVNQNIPEIDPSVVVDSEEADSFLAIYQEELEKEVKRVTRCDFAASIQWANPETIPFSPGHHLEWTTKGVAEFLGAAPGGQPFFLTLNTTTLHGPNHVESLENEARFSPDGRLENPYQYHPDRQTIFNRLDSLGIDMGDEVPHHVKHYNAGIIYMDDQVGAILDMLDENGLAENTLVIFTADHGIEPGKSVNYEQGVKVPFVARWPKVIKPGTTSDEMVQFVDFMPTFAYLGQTELPANAITDGVSFTPTFHDSTISNRDYIYFEMGYTRSVSDGKYKYIATRYPEKLVEKAKNGKLEYLTHMGGGTHYHSYIAARYYPHYFDYDQLYDLENDPYEQDNLANDPAYKVKMDEMKSALESKLKTFEHPYNLSDVSYFELPELEKLRQKTMERGTGWIPWWDREMDFPPKK